MVEIVVVDLETTFSMVTRVGAKKESSDYGDCFNPNNKIVKVGCYDLKTDKYVSFDMRLPGRKAMLEKHLSQYSGIAGHNLKYDLLWLMQIGIDLTDRKLYDTMLFEYIILKGMHGDYGLGLDVVARRYGGTAKMDIIKGFWSCGVNTDEIPNHLLSRYLYDDCKNTAMVLRGQFQHGSLLEQKEFAEMYMKLLAITTKMEFDGAKFNGNLLDSVSDYIDTELNRAAGELTGVIADLTKGHELNGGKPLNIDSPDQLMPIMYSLKLNPEKKKEWASFVMTFRPQRTGAQVKLERAIDECFIKMPYGANVKPNVAWLVDKDWVGAKGFSTGSKVIEALLNYKGLTKKQERLITALSRYSKASTWKSSNLAGVINGVKDDGFIHGKFNMSVTVTRRYSSSEPNMQNWPREGTNPLKKLITSRYENGVVVAADFKQLEFRVAGLLSGDKQLIQDVSEGFDIHDHSAKMAFGEKYIEGDKETKKKLRTEAKATTFKFQYGAMPKNKKEQAIYDAFYGKYKILAQWQEQLEYHISRDKQYKCPFTGSVFVFPEARPDNKWLWLTKAKNYPVQYLAAVINACGAIGLQQALQEYNPKCKWILTVHDSHVVDCPIECLDDVVGIIKDKMENINEVFEKYFKKTLDIQLGVDVSYGVNWFEQEDYKDERTNKHAA